MHAAFRGLRRRWMRQLAPFDLTPHQFRALNAVGRAGEVLPGGDEDPGLRLKELAELLRIAPRSATEVVDLLATKGLVERAPHPSDRRATLLSLTAEGVQLRKQVLADRKREAHEFFSVLEPTDRVELARILGELVQEGPGCPDGSGGRGWRS